MGLAPSDNRENPGKSAVAKVSVPILSQPRRVVVRPPRNHNIFIVQYKVNNIHFHPLKAFPRRIAGSIVSGIEFGDSLSTESPRRNSQFRSPESVPGEDPKKNVASICPGTNQSQRKFPKSFPFSVSDLRPKRY